MVPGCVWFPARPVETHVDFPPGTRELLACQDWPRSQLFSCPRGIGGISTRLSHWGIFQVEMIITNPGEPSSPQSLVEVALYIWMGFEDI